MTTDFYQRPMVSRLQEIFGHPHPPSRVTQIPFDAVQADLVETAAKPWHEFDESDYGDYLNDLCYVDLQQDLFDYLFPAFLIRWWEGQLNRSGGPQCGTDIYQAIDKGQVLTMIRDARRAQVLRWITDAYLDGVDQWGGQLSVTYRPGDTDDLHGPLWSFNALGLSTPVIEPILDELLNVSSLGRAQWWLVFATAVIWNQNECPAVPPWTTADGGGGVYINESGCMILRHGFLPENLSAVANAINLGSLTDALRQSRGILESTPHAAWADMAFEQLTRDPARISARIARLIEILGMEDLGGVLMAPLEASE